VQPYLAQGDEVLEYVASLSAGFPATLPLLGRFRKVVADGGQADAGAARARDAGP
jgi:hypothetical protein